MSQHIIPTGSAIEHPLNELEDEGANACWDSPLDALLAEATDIKAKSRGAGTLDDLLGEAMSIRTEAEEARVLRKALYSGMIPKEEKAATEAKIRQWELKREWVPAADVVMFTVQTCKHCGTSHSHFQGYFVRQQHKESNVSRWLAGPKPHGSSLLLKERKNEVETVEM